MGYIQHVHVLVKIFSLNFIRVRSSKVVGNVECFLFVMNERGEIIWCTLKLFSVNWNYLVWELRVIFRGYTHYFWTSHSLKEEMKESCGEFTYIMFEVRQQNPKNECMWIIFGQLSL